jgi:hypothetical protein
MPEGWLEDGPAQVPDPQAQMPADWDADEDGEWVPPLVRSRREARTKRVPPAWQ